MLFKGDDVGYIKELLNIENLEDTKNIIICDAPTKQKILSYRAKHNIIDNNKIYLEAEFVQMHIFRPSIDNQHLIRNNNPFGDEVLTVDTARIIERNLALINGLNIREHQLYEYHLSLFAKGYTYQQVAPIGDYQIIVAIALTNDLLVAYLRKHAYTQAKVNKVQSPKVLAYNYFLEEVEETISSIAKLLKAGYDYEQIVIVAPNNYHSALRQNLQLANIPLAENEQVGLLQTTFGKQIIAELKSTVNIDFEQVDSLIANSAINIINKYQGLKFPANTYYDFIINDFQNEKITVSSYSGVELCNYQSYLICDFEKYYFYLGNYQDGLISYKQDTELIDDNIRIRYQLPTSSEYNQIQDEMFKGQIGTSKCTLSFSHKIVDKHVQIANVVSGYDRENASANVILQAPKIDHLKYARANYTFQTFNTKTSNYKQLAANFDVQLKANKVGPITHPVNGLKLSYTSLNNFFKCQYKFYLQHILGIKNGQFDSRRLVVGNVVHTVLEKIDYEHAITVNDIYQQIINYLHVTEIKHEPIDDIYYWKLAKYLREICTYIQQEEAASGYPQIKREQEFSLTLDKQLDISLIGKIDKVMEKIVNDDIFVEIYDYKTGSINIDFNKVQFGLNIQNLIYFILIQESYKLEEGTEVLDGTFQHQIKPKLLYDEEDVLSTTKIKGYGQVKNEVIIKRSHTKVAYPELEQLLALTSEKITYAKEQIVNNDFKINPKVIDGKNESCSYCDYFQVCNRTNNDIQYLTTKEK